MFYYAGISITSLIGFPILPLPRHRINDGCMYIMADWKFSSAGNLSTLAYSQLDNTTSTPDIAILRPNGDRNFTVVKTIRLELDKTVLDVKIPVEVGDIISVISHDHDMIGLAYGNSDDDIAESTDLSSVMIMPDGCQNQLQENDTVHLSSATSLSKTRMAFPLTATLTSSSDAGLNTSIS